MLCTVSEESGCLKLFKGPTSQKINPKMSSKISRDQKKFLMNLLFCEYLLIF